MVGYSRREIVLVLLIVGAAGAGLVVDHWRRARPEVVERLERIDRAHNASATGVVTSERGGHGPPDRPRRLARRAADAERAAGRRKPREPAAPVDVNRAAAPELQRLPGIGPALAARIVDARPFATLDDLARVRGLRPATLERLRPLLAIR